MRLRLPQLREVSLTAVFQVVLFLALIASVSSIAYAKICGPDGCSSDVGGGGFSNIHEVQQVQQSMEHTITTQEPTLSDTTVKTFNAIGTSIIFKAVGGEPVDDGSGGVAYTTGATGTMTGLIAELYNAPPATTERYVADLLDSADIVPSAYAQGIGFSALNPVLEAWKTFRNIAYFCFVIFFIVIGFMIMLRRKVGNAAITAQQAIPSVIVALLAVTFSYAIAGLLIDIMYLVMYLILGLFQAPASTFLNMGPVEFGMNLVVGSFSNSYTAVSEAVKTLMGDVSILDDGVTVVGGFAVGVVVSLAVVFGMFRLFFELLKTYISIIIGVALAPLYLMIGAMPGKSMFGKWIRNLIGNLAAFPTVLVILLMYDRLTGGLTGSTPSITETGFKPPYLFGTGAGEVIPFLVGLGMLLITTELVVKAKKNFGATGGLFEEFGGQIGQSLKKGWTGNQDVIPGIGATNLAKYGLSGQNLLTKPFFGTDKGRKAAAQEGWKGRANRLTLGRGAMGEIQKRYELRGRGTAQGDIAETESNTATPPRPQQTIQRQRQKGPTVKI